MDLRLISLFFVSLAGALLLTPVARRLGAKLGLLDHPHHRKIQSDAVPRTGGIGVVLGMATGLAMLGVVAGPLGVPVGRELFAICVAGALIHWIGVLDDLWDIPAPVKLLAQSAAVGVVLTNGVVLHEISFGSGVTWTLGPFGYPLTAMFILGFVNAVNLVDGLDGLAAGIAAVGSFALAVSGAVGGNVVLAAIALVLLGSVLGFLPYNFDRRRKTFLGDAGSMLLGYSLAVVAIHGSRFARGDASPLLIALGCAFIPILDTATTIVRRSRRGDNLFRPDAMHLHHRLIRFGLTPHRTVGTLVATTVVVACQLLAYLVEGLGALLAVSLLAVALVTVGLRRSSRPQDASLESDPTFREIVFYLLGAQDGRTPRLRGELALIDIVARDRARSSPPAETPAPAKQEPSNLD